MAMQKYFALVMMVACVANSGCYGCFGNRMSCSSGCDTLCDASYGCSSCGLPETECGCPDADCAFPEESACGCSDTACSAPDEASCGVVGCGSAVRGGGSSCPLIKRLRKAFSGCSSFGCSSETYWSEWHNDPPCNCNSCSEYSSYSGSGSSYANAPRRSSKLVRQGANLQKELRFAEKGESVYR